MDLNEQTGFEILGDRSGELTIKRSLDVRESSWYEFIRMGNFDVPDYQRNYSWESTNTGNGKQRDEFFRTLGNKFDALDPVPTYIVDPDESSPTDRAAGLYMGPVYISQSDDAQYDVVDGQQRLVSFQLLIGALLENVDAIHTRLKNEGEGGEFLELKQSIESCKDHLANAYDSGFASLSLNKEDEEFFKMLAAQPTQTSMNTEVIGYLKTRIEKDDQIDGQNKPRAIKAANLVHYLNGEPETSHPDLRTYTGDENKVYGLDVNEISINTIKSKVQSELHDGDDEEDEESDFLSTYIRFYNSHAKLLNCYLEAYGFVERLKQDYGEGQLEKEAHTLVNFTYFVLYSIIVSVNEITSSSTDVGLEIFESINDRGKELNDVDKIRARIKYVLDEEADSGVMNNWRETLDRFGGTKSEIKKMLKYYVGATEDNVDDVNEAGNALMEVFNNHSEDYEARLSDRDSAKELVQDVYDFSEYYYHICNNNMAEESRLHLEERSDLSNKKVAQIDRVIRRLNDLGFTQWFVLGPRMCQKVDKADKDDIDDDSKGEFLRKVFDAIEVIAIRQSMSGKSGEATEGIYTTAVQSLPNPENKVGDSSYDSSAIVNELAENLINQTPNLFGSGLISNMTEQKAWHSYTNSTISKELLTRIVNADRGEEKYGSAMWDEDDDLTIEHVLPDTPISDNIKSERGEDIGRYEWLQTFFKLDEVEPDSDTENHRIAEDILEYIVEGGVITTDENAYQNAAQFFSQLQNSGLDALSSDTLEDALDAIDSADDDNKIDNDVVETALEFDPIDDAEDVKDEIDNALSALNVDQYDPGYRPEEITRLIEEINERFIDDIANLFFLSYSDNPVASNNLLSKKLAVLSDDNYDTIVVNEFFQAGGAITDVDDEFSEDDIDPFNDEESDISNDIALRADQAWTYEAAFERKAELIETIVTHLKFEVDPDHQRYGENEFEFSGDESLVGKIESEVERDMERRLQRDNF